jgi:hypothetical protein
MNTINKEYFMLRKKQGLKAGIVPVPTPPDEEKCLRELERLGILDKYFESDRRFNNITQIEQGSRSADYDLEEKVDVLVPTGG